MSDRRGGFWSSQDFLPRTYLLPGEYRANFRQIDRDAICIVTSPAARKITNLMAHIYLCLVDAPFKLREREGVLRFTGEVREGTHMTAWQQLTELLGVADGTAHKALSWMAQQKLIGYFAGKNGVGIRIFLNRATNSIKQEAERQQKNLRLVDVASDEAHISPDATLSINYARKSIDPKKDPRGAAHRVNSDGARKKSADAQVAATSAAQSEPIPVNRRMAVQQTSWDAPAINEIVQRLCKALEPKLQATATQSAVHAARREHERTREWLDKYGLPKAARVAQREAYNIFKHHGRTTAAKQQAGAEVAVGSSPETPAPGEVKERTTEEIAEVAEMCLALLTVHGKPIEETLGEISTEGGWLLPADVPKVRSAAALLEARDGGR